MEYIEQKSEYNPSDSFLRTPGVLPEIPFCIRTLGVTKQQGTHMSKGTYFEDGMLTWFPQGRGMFYFTSGRLEVSQGMLGLVLPGEGESLLRSDPEDPYRHYYCRFAGEEALRMAQEVRRMYPEPFFYHARAVEAGRILEAMVEKGIPREVTDPARRMRPVEAQLALILSLLCEKPLPVFRKSRGLTLHNLSEYMLQHLSEPASLDAAARYFRMSKSYFCRECRRLLGTTYQKALEREKMLWASGLLRDGMLDLTVAEVAYQVGYNDPLYFSKVFKRIQGVPPSRLKASS